MSKITIRDIQISKSKSNEKFRSYEEDCSNFINELRKRMVFYLECKDDWVTFETISDEEIKLYDNVEVLKIMQSKKLAFCRDTSILFIINIKLQPDNVYPQEIIALPLSVRKKENIYVVRHWKREFSIITEDQKSWDNFYYYLFTSLVEYFSSAFEKLISGEKQTFGFRVFTY